ncbi:MAG TPA: ABC transporter permease [Microbacterium sp.]|nr:ABC transporter permease [Microbacterium sp.]
MRAIVHSEALKLRASLVGRVGTLAIIGGIALLSGGMLLAVVTGQPDLVAKLGPAATADWAGLLSMAVQITGAGALLGCGVVLAWMFGREFADATVSGLFALPVGRGRLAAGKLAVFALWACGTAIGATCAVLVVGLVAGLGVPSPAVWAGLGRHAALLVFSCAIVIPVAWVTTLARSTLGGVTATIVIVVVAQVGVLAGAGGWMPLAAPTLWAMSGGNAVTSLQLAITLAVAAVSAVLVVHAWHRLQLDR